MDVQHISFNSAILLFPVAVILHILEEWPGFPRWVRRFASPEYSNREYVFTHVLAVAGAARDHIEVLIIGLMLSIALMGLAATLIAKLLHKYPWISYAGVFIVLFVAVRMIWDGFVRLHEAGGLTQFMQFIGA